MVRIIREPRRKIDNIDVLKNTIVWGDSLKVLKKIPDNSIQLIITSPPYLLDKDYEDEMDFKKYIKKQRQIIKECYRVLSPRGSIFWNVAQTINKNRVFTYNRKKFFRKEIIPLGSIFYDLFKSISGVDFIMKGWIIWHFEGGPVPSTRFAGRYENILWFVKSDNYVFNLDDVRVPSKWANKGDKRCNPNGKNPEDFWEFDYCEDIFYINRVTNNNKEEKTPHPCQFPEALVERLIKVASNKGDIVLDIYNGSGTTTHVANRLKRHWIGIDKSLDYCKIAKLRMENRLEKTIENNNVKILNNLDEIPVETLNL